MTSAKEFREKFLDSYRMARESHRDEWDAIWTDTARWSNLMIYDPGSVVKSVAEGLHLKCHQREPLSFDAVFVKPTNPPWDWFPVVVAIEHENNPKTFDGEVKKLLSIRCRLKVGITYVLSSDTGDADALRTKIASNIQNQFGTIKG